MPKKGTKKVGTGKKLGRGLAVFLLVLLLLLGGGYFYLRKLYSGFTDPSAPDVVEKTTSSLPQEEPSSGFTSVNPFASSSSSEAAAATSEVVSEEAAPPLTDLENDDGTGTGDQGKWQPIYEKEQRDEDVLNILLLGIDVEDFDQTVGRSDCMMLLSFQKETGRIRLYTIHRDCLVQIPGHGWNKLNTAYAYGRVGMTINLLNDLFGLDIQKYATIDWSGLKELIDYMDGVTVPLTAEEIAYYGWEDSKQPGMNLLTGKEARRHVANRSLAQDDWGRSRRQRDLLQAIFEKVTTEYSLGELTDFVRYAAGVVKTNISFEMALSYATAVYRHRSDIRLEAGALPYPGTYTEGWYQHSDGWLAVVKTDFAGNRARLEKELYGSEGETE